MNKDSANFGLLVSMLTTPVTVLFWYLFPTLGGGSLPPVYSVVIPFVFIVLGCVVWRRWEIIERNRLEEKIKNGAVNP